jgi:hypothetical protein
LTEDNEQNIRKKISVRAACLISSNDSLKQINYFANWINYFYKIRCDIVHNAYSFVEADSVDERYMGKALLIVKYSIPAIIESLVSHDIKSFSALKTYIESVKCQHGVSNAFDFITDDGLELFFEDE